MHETASDLLRIQDLLDRSDVAGGQREMRAHRHRAHVHLRRFPRMTGVEVILGHLTMWTCAERARWRDVTSEDRTRALRPRRVTSECEPAGHGRQRKGTCEPTNG